MSTYRRPVPLVGDTSTAAERSGRPDAWALDPGEIDVVDRVMAARRDIRRFRPDDVTDTVLRAVLAAAHAAPSVGHSQPWRFVIVRDPSLRAAAAAMADRNRLEQAARLDPESGRQLLDLQLEGLREAPLGVVVGCDRRTAPDGVLGRATMPDADLWSCACAIENLWLAARARGLGVGWVTFFEPAQLAGLVGFPPGVVPLGWLCVGYPDERPPAPGLERRGWSSRLPLDEVVAADRWPAGDATPPPPSRLPPPPVAAATGVRDRRDPVLSPPDGFGLLDRQLDRVERALTGASAPAGPVGGALLVAVGQHPVADLGVSAYPRSVSGDLLAATASAESVGARTAEVCGLGFHWFDAGTADGDLVVGDALTPTRVDRLLDGGRQRGGSLASDGLVAIGEIGVGNTTVAAALACALLGLPAGEAVGLGAGSDSSIVATKRAVVQRAVARVGRRDPVGLLAGLGGPEVAYLVGVILGVAGAGGVVVLDGCATSVAACLATELEPGVGEHLVAGQQSSERGHAAVLRHLGLEPLLQLRLRTGEGVGAALATRLLLDGLRIRTLAPRTG